MRVQAYRDITQATISIDNADGMVALAGGLWVKTDDGRVVRVDAATSKITLQVKVDRVSDPSHYCQGIGSDGTRVWACATRDTGTDLVQLDPISGHTLRTVAVDKVFDQLAIPFAAGRLWVLSADGSQLSAIDPATGSVTRYQLGRRCLQVAAHAARVVATCALSNEVVELDAATGRIVAVAAAKDARIAALIGAEIWVDTAEGVARFPEGMSSSTVLHGLYAGTGGDLYADADTLWLRSSQGVINHIDARTDRVLDQINPDRTLSGGSLVVAFGSIWTTAGDEGELFRLRLG